MIGRLVARFAAAPPPPLPPQGQPVVVVVTVSHALICVSLVLLVRVLHMLSRVREAERTLLALASKRQAERDADAAQSGAFACWDDGTARTPADTESESASESSPTQSFRESEAVLTSPLALRLACKVTPLRDPALVRRLAGKEPPCHACANIDELISTHRGALTQMLVEAKGCPGYREGSTGLGSHDELFALRFLLSHKLHAHAAGAAMRTTLEWRERNRADEIRAFVRSAPQSAFPAHEHIGRYFPMPITEPEGDWPPFMVVNTAELNPSEMMKHISVDDFVRYSIHISEKLAARCDEITRRTRRLTKAVRMMSMCGLRLKHASMGFARAASAAAKDHVDCYPQNLGFFFLCNVPYPMKVVWDTAVMPLLPRQVCEKTSVLNPSLALADLDELTNHVQLQHLPHNIYPGSMAM